jgi:hypothetical protein
MLSVVQFLYSDWKQHALLFTTTASTGLKEQLLQLKHVLIYLYYDHSSVSTSHTAFIAPKGYKIIYADNSQIELWLLAQVANVAALKEAFANRQHIHKITDSFSLFYSHISYVFLIKTSSVVPNYDIAGKW